MRLPVIALMASLLSIASVAQAQEMVHPDDRVTFTLAAEDWVTSKTARVTVNVAAAASGSNAGTMRADMLKAVNGLASGDWRMVSFNRDQDSTGLEHWNASFETRLPDSGFGGLADAARKASKPGMQLTLGDVDFTPTLAENQAARDVLRIQIYKQAADQLTALNTALPGRGYRIAAIDFNESPFVAAVPRARPMMAQVSSDGAASVESPLQNSEKIQLAARVTLATGVPVASDKH